MRAELVEEASNLRTQLGFQNAGWPRALLLYLLLIAIFGVFLPWQKGRDFLDSVILGVYACLGVVFAAPAAAPEFERFPTSQQAVARVMISVLYGELVAGVMVVLGITTVYASRWGRIVVGPNLRSLAECALFGLTLSLAVSTAAVCVAARFSTRAAKGVVRLVFLGLLVGFYLRSGWLPTVALRGSGIALLVFILCFLALRAMLTSRDREA
jgi:hypothetical protein